MCLPPIGLQRDQRDAGQQTTKGEELDQEGKERGPVTNQVDGDYTICERGLWGFTKNLQKSWGGNIYEATQDLEAAPGAPQGQAVSPGFSMSGIFHPLQRLPYGVYRCDRQKVWCEGERTHEGCKTTERGKLHQGLEKGVADRTSAVCAERPCGGLQPYHWLGRS